MITKAIRFATLLIISQIVIQNISSAQGIAQKIKNTEKLENKKTPLFNGKDFRNWLFNLKYPSIEPSTVFTIQNGVIHISGYPFGYMRTKNIYSDYKLHVEWRWPSEASNSGVFVNAQKPDTIWLIGRIRQ